METIHTEKLPTTESAKSETLAKPVSVQESVMVGRLLQNTVQKLSQDGLQAINANRAMQSIKTAFPTEFSQIQVQHRQAQIDNPLPDPNSLKPLSQQTKDSWFNGQVVTASVIKTNTDGSATVVIDKQTVDLKLPGNGPKLEMGQRLALTVEKPSSQPLSFSLSHSPEQSAKLLNMVETSSSQQRSLSPMLATLDAIVQMVNQINSESGQINNPKAYPEGFIKAVRELAGQISNGQQLSNPEGFKQAVSQSGVFLENNIKISQSNSIDLKQLDNLVKTAASKSSDTPLSQALQQLQTAAQQLAPRINNQVSISPEISQTLQKAFVEQQQQISLNLKTESKVVSKPELMTVLQSLTQLAVKSEGGITQLSPNAGIEQITSNKRPETISSAQTESLRQLQQAVRQLVLDTSNQALSKEQVAQLSKPSSNLTELSNTLKSLANTLQGNDRSLFNQSKPLVQAVSQAVIEMAGKQISEKQLAVLKQNPQTIANLAQVLKTSAQVLDSLPTSESRNQADKLIQALNSTLNSQKGSDKTVSQQFERVIQQFSRAIPTRFINPTDSSTTFPKTEIANTLKNLADSIQNTNPAKQAQIRPVVQTINQAVMEYAGQNISKAQRNQLQQNLNSTNNMANSLRSAAQVVQSVPIPENNTVQQKVLQALSQVVSQKVVNNPQLNTQIEKFVSEQPVKAEQKPLSTVISRNELSNVVKSLTIPNTSTGTNQLAPLISALNQSIIDYAGKNLSPSQSALLQQSPRTVNAINSSIQTAAQVIQAVPIPDSPEKIEKLLQSIARVAEASGKQQQVAQTEQISKQLSNISNNPVAEKSVTADSSKNNLSNVIRSLANSIQSSPSSQLNTLTPVVQNLTQAVISYAGNNITSAQVSQLQQTPQNMQAVGAALRTVADIVQSGPIPEARAKIDKVLNPIQQIANLTLANNKPAIDQLNNVIQQFNQLTAENQNKSGATSALTKSAEGHLTAAQLQAISKSDIARSSSATIQNDATLKSASNQNSNQPAVNQPQQSASANKTQAEQLSALKMLRETLAQTNLQNNPAITQALSKTVIENADKLLTSQQLERLNQNHSNPKELSIAIKAIEEKISKMANRSAEQQKQMMEKLSQSVLNNAGKGIFNQELSGLKSATIKPQDLSLALKNIAQTLDKNTLEGNPQIKRLIENISQSISNTSSNNFKPSLLQNLLQQPPKTADIAEALKTLQTMISRSSGAANSAINSYPAQLLQSMSQTILNNGERILQASVLSQLQQQTTSYNELQAKFDLVQKILTNPGDVKLFKSGQERILQFTHDRMLQSVSQNLVQNSFNPIPQQQLSQLAKQPLAIPQLLSVLQSLNQSGGEKSANNMFVNQLLQNISRQITQAAQQGSELNRFNQVTQTSNQQIPELLKQLTGLTQDIEKNRPDSSNNMSQAYPRKFVQAMNQLMQQLSQQFLSNNQALAANNDLSFVRSQINNFSQQLQQITQGINQSLNTNPAQSQINSQVMQDFRANIQNLLNVLKQIQSPPSPAASATAQLTPAASLGQAFSQQPGTIPGDLQANMESGKEMPLANKTKHAQVVQAIQNPALQFTNLATFQQAFIEQLEGALARILATQGSNREQADSNVNMALEIPFRFQEKSQVLQVRMSSQDKHLDDTGGKIWTANLAFELQSLGAIRIYITLDGKEVSMQFWTENPESQAIFKDNFSLLSDRLATAGYRVAQLGSYLGVPEEARQEIKRNKLGVVDEHV